MYVIALEEMDFFAFHGYYDEERKAGNHFLMDLHVTCKLGKEAENDELGGTINYELLYLICQSEMKKPTRLLEAIFHRIANHILKQFDAAIVVRVVLRKKQPPLDGKVKYATVRLTRRRK